MPLSEADKWLDHLGSCSPCYSDFSQLRQAYQHGHRRTLLAIAAGVLLVATVASWAFVHRRNEALLAQTTVLDLRDRSVARGTEPNPDEQPLELNRRPSKVRILLPLGSSEGPYDVRIATLSGEELVASSGTAKLSDHVDSLQLALTLDSLRPGKYVLQIRRPESEWVSYALVLR